MIQKTVSYLVNSKYSMSILLAIKKHTKNSIWGAYRAKNHSPKKDLNRPVYINDISNI
jgi:hypothetical protein